MRITFSYICATSIDNLVATKSGILDRNIEITKRDLTFFFSLLILAGLFTSNFFRALPSIAILGLFLVSAIDFEKDWKSEFKKYGGWIGVPYLILKAIIGRGLIHNFLVFLRKREFAFLSAIILVHLLSYFQTDYGNYDEYWKNIEVKSAIFAIPFCYAALPGITKGQFRGALYFYTILLFIAGINSILMYLSDMEAVNEAMSRSKPFPVPVNHVRFSLMMAMGAFSSFYLFRKGYFVIGKWEKYLHLSLMLFFVGFLHLASVRSGLFVLYALIGCLVFYYIIRGKKIIYSLLVIVGLAGVTLGSYYIFPTIRNKVEVTLTDFKKADMVVSANYYPLSARIFSYKVGYHLWKEKPLFGTGIGNLKREVKKEYTARYWQIFNHIMPHNQYIRYLTAFGIVGLLIFLATFYYPLLHKKNYIREPMLTIHYAIVSISFLFEGTLETQLGLNFSLIFIVLALSQLRGEQEKISS